MRNKLNLKAIILIIGALFSTQPLFGLVLVHNEFALAPKKPGSPATEVSVTANGARYRFIVGIKPGGHHPNPEGGFVYATDGYKYDQSKIKWEVQIRGSWTAITGDTTNEWGFFKIETAEAENRYLMSLHWQTPVKNETCHIRVKGERWPYRPGIGVGPYDPAWESAVDSLLEHPVINITTPTGEAKSVSPGGKIEFNATADIITVANRPKNGVKVFYECYDPDEPDNNTGGWDGVGLDFDGEGGNPPSKEGSTETKDDGCIPGNFHVSNAIGDNYKIKARSRETDELSKKPISESAEIIVGFKIEITETYGIDKTDKFIPLSSKSSQNEATIKYKIFPKKCQLDSVKIQVFKSDEITKIYEKIYEDSSHTKYTGTDLKITWDGTDNQTSNNYADPDDDTHKIKLVGVKGDDSFETELKDINVLPLPDSAYLVTRTGLNVPDDTNKVLNSGASVSLYSVLKCEVDKSKYRYYLGDEGSPLPSQVKIGGTIFDCSKWLSSKWGKVTISWKQVDPKSVAHKRIDWKTENLLGWSGWDHSEVFGEGSRWFRVYFAFQGYTPSSPEKENSRRVSLKGPDANTSAALAASYIYVPYVSVAGKPVGYEEGVDCSALCCLVKGIPRTWADNLHDNYLRPTSDNDVNEDMIPDHPEPWQEGINKSTAGDMWYVDSNMEKNDKSPVDHVGIFTGDYVIHASAGESEVVRHSNPRNNSWWNGGLDTTIYRGVGTN